MANCAAGACAKPFRPIHAPANAQFGARGVRVHLLRISVDENRLTDLANAACRCCSDAFQACLRLGSMLACLQRAAPPLRAIWSEVLREWGRAPLAARASLASSTATQLPPGSGRCIGGSSTLLRVPSGRKLCQRREPRPRMADALARPAVPLSPARPGQGRAKPSGRPDSAAIETSNRAATQRCGTARRVDRSSCPVPRLGRGEGPWEEASCASLQ